MSVEPAPSSSNVEVLSTVTVPPVVKAEVGGSSAIQDDQESAVDTNIFVSPGTQQFHPSAAKFWLKATANSTTIEASYNVTSVADTGTGVMTVTIGTDFSSIDWAAALSVVFEPTASFIIYVPGLSLDPDPAAGTCVMFMTRAVYDVFNDVYTDAEFADPTAWLLTGYGDQS